jgi:hypothetical protein
VRACKAKLVVHTTDARWGQGTWAQASCRLPPDTAAAACDSVDQPAGAYTRGVSKDASTCAATTYNLAMPPRLHLVILYSKSPDMPILGQLQSDEASKSARETIRTGTWRTKRGTRGRQRRSGKALGDEARHLHHLHPPPVLYRLCEPRVYREIGSARGMRTRSRMLQGVASR